MLLEGLLMLAFGFLLEKKTGPVRRKKIPYIIKNNILQNSEKYYLSFQKPYKKHQKKK